MLKVLLALGLLTAAMAASPSASATQLSAYRALVTVSFYLDVGPMHDTGRGTYPGAAACSWDLPTYTVVEFPDGRRVTCEDQGLLGSGPTGSPPRPSWVDIHCNLGLWACVNSIESVYGDMTALVPVVIYLPY